MSDSIILEQAWTQMLTLRQVLSLPTVQYSLITSMMALAGFFFYFERNLETEKQKSWLLTFASSLVCTVGSLPSFYEFWRSGWDVTRLTSSGPRDTMLVCFFISYLVLDLTLGSRYYQRQIQWVTGWLHHTFYTVLLIYFLKRQIASFFTTAAILELPTLILSCGALSQGAWRSDAGFAITFFFLRLVLPTLIVVPLKRQHPVRSLWMVAVAVLPLHLYWFYGIIRSNIRRHRQRKATSSSSKPQPEHDRTTTTRPTTTPRIQISTPAHLNTMRMQVVETTTWTT